MNAFFKQYKHPNWQKKRLEILERDDYTCVQCQETEKELQVHHGYYGRNMKPWDYPEETLWSLCDDCHKRNQHFLDEIKRLLGEANLDDLQVTLGFLKGLIANHRQLADEEGSDVLIPVGAWPDDIEQLFGLGYFFGISGEEVHAKSKDGMVTMRRGRLATAK